MKTKKGKEIDLPYRPSYQRFYPKSMYDFEVGSKPDQQWRPFRLPMRKVNGFSNRQMDFMRSLVPVESHLMKSTVIELVELAGESLRIRAYPTRKEAFETLITCLLSPQDRERYWEQADRLGRLDLSLTMNPYWSNRGYLYLVLLHAAMKMRLDTVERISGEQFEQLFYYSRSTFGAVHLLSEYLTEDDHVSVPLDWWLKLSKANDYSELNYSYYWIRKKCSSNLEIRSLGDGYLQFSRF